MKIGIATSWWSGELNVSEGHKLNIRDECQDFFIGVVSKLREQSPLKYRLTRAISALNPELTISNSNLAGKEMNDLLTILHESNLIKGDKSDHASMQIEKNFCKLLVHTMNSKSLIYTSADYVLF